MQIDVCAEFEGACDSNMEYKQGFAEPFKWLLIPLEMYIAPPLRLRHLSGKGKIWNMPSAEPSNSLDFKITCT